MNPTSKHIRPITYRQIRAIEIWLVGGCKSKARALREAGYGESVARQPHKVFGSHAVLGELEMQGYDGQGVRTEPQAIDLGEIPPPEPTLAIDFSKVSKEWLQDLKERLREVPGADPFIRKEEGISLTSTTASIGIDHKQE